MRSSKGSDGFPSRGEPYVRLRAPQTLRTTRLRTEAGLRQIVPVCSRLTVKRRASPSWQKWEPQSTGTDLFARCWKDSTFVGGLSGG
jgi:hypothetical protein